MKSFENILEDLRKWFGTGKKGGAGGGAAGAAGIITGGALDPILIKSTYIRDASCPTTRRPHQFQ